MGVAQRYQKLLIHHSFGMPHLAKYDMQFRRRRSGLSPTRRCPESSSMPWPRPRRPRRRSRSSPASSRRRSSSPPARATSRRSSGLKVVLYLEYEFGTRDFGPIAARIKDANLDLLWVGALGLDGNLVLRS